MLTKLSALICSFMFTLSVLAPARAANPPEKDVIVLVLVDAMRPDHMGSYGYAKPTTPNLDVFAKEGVRYTRMYVNAPWTRPSTASFLTGYHASRHGAESYKTKLPKSVTTLAERLKKQGYTTAGFTANGNGGSLAGLQKGFDVFEDPTNTYHKKIRGKTYCCNGLPSGEFLTKRVIDWYRKDKSPKKFIFIFYVDPHDPYGAPPHLEKMFLGDYKGKPRRHASWEYKNNYPAHEVKSMVALYDAGIRFADESLADFFSVMKKRGDYDDATIMVSADHGEGFGEHDFFLHAHHFWEEVVHVPLLIKGPRFQAGAVETRVIDSLDVVATIADLTGARSDDLPGVSLLNTAAKPQPIISEYNEFGIHRQAIVGERYKVIWQRPADEEWYLREAKKKEYFPSVSFDKEVIRVFDLKADPKERNDLAEKMPAEAAALLKQLRAFVEESQKLAALKK